MQIFTHFSPDTLPSDALRENIRVERSFTQEVKRMQSSHFLAFVYALSFFFVNTFHRIALSHSLSLQDYIHMYIH